MTLEVVLLLKKITLQMMDIFQKTLLGQIPLRKSEIVQAIVSSGIETLPIISVSTAFTGLVVTNEIAWHLHESLQSVTMMPGFTGQFVVRELGIAIPALLIVANSGASTTAEIGTMKITDQIDALTLLGIDPISFLVFPRFIASMISMSCLIVISVFITLICASAVAVLKYHFTVPEYFNATVHFIHPKDLVGALIKGVVFGAVIPIISCAYGFQCKGGAEGVGLATTNSVVTSTFTVICLDFLLTYLFTLLF